MAHTTVSGAWRPVAGFALVVVAACGAPEPFRVGGRTDGGASGGMTGVGTGGAFASGGAAQPGGTGGGPLGTGGSAQSGGSTGSGGSGGAAGTGGTPGSGGKTAPSSGGAPGSGGTTAATGGMTAATGGRPGTGGTTAATGGRSGTGGATGTGGGTASSGGASGTGTVLFIDDFESGAGKWTTTMPTSDWSVVTDGTKVFKEGAAFTSTPRMAWAGATTLTNMVVEARVKVLAFAGQSTSYHAGVCARVKDTSTFYAAVLDSTGRVAIKKSTAGVSNTNIASTDAGIVTNSWYTVRFQVVGSTLTLFLNGVMKLTINDGDITAGGFGLTTKNAQAEYDDVRITTP